MCIRDRISTDNQIHDDSPTEQQCAHWIISLISDKRFCQTLIKSSPITALEIFRSIKEHYKYFQVFSPFVRNFKNAAINDKSSFLYNEISGYDSGLFGSVKPLSSAMFKSSAMVERIDGFLSIDHRDSTKWDSENWDAYFLSLIHI